MAKRWSRYLKHPLSLGFLISILIVFLFARYLPRYHSELSEQSALSNKGEVYFFDLDNNGNSEKLHYYQYERIFQPTLYLYDSKDNFQSLWNFGELPVKQSQLFAGDYNNNGKKEIFLFTMNADSLFLYVLDTQNDRKNIINRHLIATGQFSENPLKITSIGLYNLNQSQQKEFLFTVDAGYPLLPVKIFSFSISKKELLSSPEFKLDISKPLIVKDINKDNKPEIIVSGNSLNSQNNGSLSKLVVLNHNLEYHFPPIIFYGNESQVTASVISKGNHKNIAVLHSGATSKNVFNNLMIFDAQGKIIKESTIDYKANLQLTELADEGYIFLYSGSKILKYSNDLKLKRTYHISQGTADLVACENMIGDEEKEIVFKSENHLILVSDKFRSKVKLSVPGRGRIILTAVKKKNTNNQLSLQIGQRWYLYNLFKNENFFYSHIFYYLIFIIVTSSVYLISRFYSVIKSRKQSRSKERDLLAVVEENIEKQFVGLKSKIGEMGQGAKNQSIRELEKEIDNTLKNVKTISQDYLHHRRSNSLKNDLLEIIGRNHNPANIHLNIYSEDIVQEINETTKKIILKFTDRILDVLDKNINNNPVEIQVVLHQEYIHLLIEAEETLIDKEEILNNKELVSLVNVANGKSEVDVYSNHGTAISTTFSLLKENKKTTTSQRIKIIIAEDHDVSLFGLISMFKTKHDIELVGTAKNGMEVLNLLKTKDTDIVITDISMPGMDGIELSEQLKNNYPEIKVIVFTMYMENWFVEQLMNNGAKGFVSKNSKMIELVEAVRTVYKADNYYCPQFKSKFGFKVNSNGGIQKKLDSLSKNELQIIKHYADNFTKDQIAVEMNLNFKTMDTFVANILLKLHASDETEIIRIAKKQKFVSE